MRKGNISQEARSGFSSNPAVTLQLFALQMQPLIFDLGRSGGRQTCGCTVRPARMTRPHWRRRGGTRGPGFLSISQSSLRRSPQPFSWLCPDVQALSGSMARGFPFAGLVRVSPRVPPLTGGCWVRTSPGSGSCWKAARTFRNPKTLIRAVRSNPESNRKSLDCSNTVLFHFHFTKKSKINSQQG